ncbi:MAG: hypothetical protein FJ318_02280 [SAR202 cluster bacterium]|nr:hypothetical protein [SAR202 cluster bacterium]
MNEVTMKGGKGGGNWPSTTGNPSGGGRGQTRRRRGRSSPAQPRPRCLEAGTAPGQPPAL